MILEAQTSWVKAFRGLYNWLRGKIPGDQPEDTNQGQISSLRFSPSDYARLKDTRGQPIFDQLLRYLVHNISLSAPSPYSSGTIPTLNSQSFAKSIEDLTEALNSGEQGCIRLWYSSFQFIYLQNTNRIWQSVVSNETLAKATRRKLSSSTTNMIPLSNELYKTPLKTILLTVTREWQAITAPKTYVGPRKATWPTRIIQLPSKSTCYIANIEFITKISRHSFEPV